MGGQSTEAAGPRNGSEVNIRLATPSDARAIERVRMETWRTTYRGHFPDHLLDGIDLDRWASRREGFMQQATASQSYFVAEEAGEIVGFADAGPARGEAGRGEVYAIYILAGHQRRGIGRALISHATRHLHAHDLQGLIIWVLRENENGRAFYERLGGRAEREQPITIAETEEVIETAYLWEDTVSLREIPPSG